MRFPAIPALALMASLLAPAAGQVVAHIPDPSLTLGGSNAFPFNQLTGFTSIHFYRASELMAAGVAPGAVLQDVAVAPVATTGGGTYNAPTARLLVGHMLFDTPQPTAWESQLDLPAVIHDFSSGPYTFPWLGGGWISLPGFSSGAFFWDGARDIAILYSSSPGVTGGFNVRTSATHGRFGVTTTGATIQVPTTTGYFGMKVRLTFSGQPVTMNRNEASIRINGQDGALTLYGNDPLNLTVNSTTALGNPFFLFFSPSYSGGHLPMTGQSFDLGYVFGNFLDVFSIGLAGPQPLVGGPLLPLGTLDVFGSFSLPLTMPCTGAAPRFFLQAVLLDATQVPENLRVTGISSFDLKTACRFASTATFPMPIPDAGAALTPSIMVPPGIPITDLDLLLDITHAQVSDLLVTLTLNGTTSVILMNPNTPSDPSDLGGRCHFSDEALLSLDAAATQSGTTILPGRFIGDSPLSAFDALDAGGTWTLTIQDTVAANTGSLNGFSILVNGSE